MVKKTPENNVHEFDVITNGGKIEYLKFGEETIELRPLKMKKIRELLSIVRFALPVALKDMEKYAKEMDTLDPKKDALKVNMISNFSMLGATMSLDFTDRLVKFICDHIGKPVEWFDETLEPEQAMKILKIMSKQNRLDKYFPFLQKTMGI